jgi:glycosyltransferase involved in cell wall biosynthesis
LSIKRTVCVISFSNLQNDPRVRRQIFALKETYDITTLGLKKSNIPGVREFVLLDKRTFWGRLNSRILFLLTRLFKSLYKHYIKKKYSIKEVFEILQNYHFDLVVANGLDALIIGYAVANIDGARILFDAHEYEPKRIEDHWFHKLFVNPYKDFLCRRYLPSVDAMTTVSPGITKEFNRVYGITPELIMNIPKYEKVDLKGVDSGNVRLIHHGLAHPSRNLEKMIKIMPLVEEKFNLTLMLVGQDSYMKNLKCLAKKLCPQKVIFKNPVKYEQIIPTISEYDIGLVIIEPTSLKLKYALPNKFFESIMAGLCVITGPSPDMVKIIEKYNCGFVAKSFNVNDVADLITSLTTEDIQNKKKASLKTAKTLNAEMEMKKFQILVKKLIGK